VELWLPRYDKARVDIDSAPPVGNTLPKLHSDMAEGRRPPAVLNDRFEVRDLLGRGGLGAVYRGVDRRSGAAVAIKMIRGIDDRTQAIERYREGAGDRPAFVGRNR